MNLLSRRTSSKSLTERAQRGRSEGQNTAAVDRSQSESKTSLFGRLRRSSRSGGSDGPKAAETAASQLPAESVGDKHASSKVTEVKSLGSSAALKEKSQAASPVDPVTHKKMAALPTSAEVQAEGGMRTQSRSSKRPILLTDDQVLTIRATTKKMA
jgi:hypothetical protein